MLENATSEVYKNAVVVIHTSFHFKQEVIGHVQQ